MKQLTLLQLALVWFMSLLLLTSCTEPVKNEQFSENKEKAKKLLSSLTLEDKIGEMTQLAIDVLCVGNPYNLQDPVTLDEEKLKKVLVDLRVGSILNVGGHAYSREEWKLIISTIQKYAIEEKPTGIPVLYGIDAVHGVNYTIGATLFPQQLGLASSWNPALAREMGAVTAYETRASGIPWDFSPVLDIGRDARWPRLWETFGEDVHLASKMGEELIIGYQGDNTANPHKVAACLKHFIGYSMPLTGKDRTPAWIPERHLQEYFVPTFQAAVDAGAKTVMICSGDVNGIPVHSNPLILKDLLRDQMGFQGVAVSDWEDIGLLVSRHRVAQDFKEAIGLAVNAGIDMAMVPMDTEFPILLKELVEEGVVPMDRIDEAALRVLTLKYELGLFENPFYPFEDYTEFNSEAHQSIAREAAQESVVMLKNEDDILPLTKSAKILVTGPTAHSLNVLNGGWTGVWQGNDPNYSTDGAKTILEAIQSKIGGENVTYLEGASYDEVEDIQQVVTASKRHDIAVVCVGEMTYTEIVGSIDEMRLPAAQFELVERISATGTPVVVVLVEGRPRVITEIEEASDAIVAAFLPGDFGGEAIADVLFGDVNPSGKLPITYPRFSNSLLTYDHKGTDLVKQDFSMNAFNPQWEFGHGLSYTEFIYSDLHLDKNKLSQNNDDKIQISVNVRNNGKRAGKEVIQLFISDMVASITPPVKRLRAFEKINLEVGESKTITFSISAKDLAFVGIENKWITEPGAFEIEISGLNDVFEID